MKASLHITFAFAHVHASCKLLVHHKTSLVFLNRFKKIKSNGKSSKLRHALYDHFMIKHLSRLNSKYRTDFSWLCIGFYF